MNLSKNFLTMMYQKAIPPADIPQWFKEQHNTMDGVRFYYLIGSLQINDDMDKAQEDMTCGSNFCRSQVNEYGDIGRVVGGSETELYNEIKAAYDNEWATYGHADFPRWQAYGHIFCEVDHYFTNPE